MATSERKKGCGTKKPVIWIVVLLVVICVVATVCLLIGSGKQPTEEWPMQSDGTPMHDGPAVRTEEGYLTMDGKTYQYCHVLTGTFNNAVSESTLLVYTDTKTVTFEQAAKQFWGSNLINYPEMSIYLHTYGDEDTNEYNTSAGLTLTLEEVTPQGAKWKVQTASGSAFDYGSNYSVERWINNGWYEQPIIFDNYAWTAVLYHAEGSASEAVTWAHHGTLPAGKYRFIKTVKQGNTEYPLAVEFEIK